MAKHNGKCEQCGKSLRVSVEQFIGPAKSKPIAPGETMPGGTMTCIKQLSGTSWCADFRVGNWAIVEGRKICTTCAEAKLDPNNHPAVTTPTRYALTLIAPALGLSFSRLTIYEHGEPPNPNTAARPDLPTSGKRTTFAPLARAISGLLSATMATGRLLTLARLVTAAG